MNLLMPMDLLACPAPPPMVSPTAISGTAMATTALLKTTKQTTKNHLEVAGATDLAAPTGTITVDFLTGPVMVFTACLDVVRISAAWTVSLTTSADSQVEHACADLAALRSARRANRPCRPDAQSPQSPARESEAERRSAVNMEGLRCRMRPSLAWLSCDG